MAWKDILVFADGSENGLARARIAAKLAVAHAARLEMCVPAIIPAPGRPDDVTLIRELSEQARQLARDDAGRVLDVVRAAFPALSDRISVEALETTLAHAAKFAAELAFGDDLVVVGQPIEEDASHLDDALLQGALLGSGRPCLVLPRWPEPRSLGKRILLAWKGVREAARAAHDAVPLLVRAAQVRVFAAGAEPASSSILSRLMSHLARHGVAIDSPTQLVAGDAIGEVILREAKRFDADLIVMGGYGRSRTGEMLFGGATRTILRASPAPVLLSH
jgi:nucleotide-binding universal stress UspA family protein